MPKVLEGSARELILNIKKFCEAEKECKALLIPLKNVRARVAALAGVSQKTVSRIVREGKIAATTSSKLVTPGKKRPHPKKILLDHNDLGFIRQKIHHHYVTNKELPSVNKLRLELQTEINFQGSNTTLRRILKNIGFKFKTQEKSTGDKTVKKKAAPKPKEDTSNIIREGEGSMLSIYIPPAPFPNLQMQNMQPIQNIQNIQQVNSMPNLPTMSNVSNLSMVRELPLL